MARRPSMTGADSAAKRGSMAHPQPVPERPSALAQRSQQLDLFVAADQRAQSRPAQCLKPARDDARAQHLPSRHRYSDAFDLDGSEIAVIEEIANQPARARGDDDRVWFGKSLQTGGDVGRLANDRLLLSRAF